MDIHKPKPWHGVREFLKEYVIIVIGVLTALAGEQAVETARTHREVAETREAIHGEIANNAMRAKVMIAENTCAGGAKAKILAWLAGGPKPASGTRPMMLPLSSTVWDTAHSKGVANMPMDEQLGLAGYYTGIRLYNDNENRRRDAALRFSSIALLDHLTSEQAGRLLEELNGLEIMRAYQLNNARRVMDFASSMKIEPQPVEAGMRENSLDIVRRPAWRRRLCRAQAKARSAPVADAGRVRRRGGQSPQTGPQTARLPRNWRASTLRADALRGLIGNAVGGFRASDPRLSLQL